MSQRAFIEWHRAYQDSGRKTRSDRITYQTLADQHPQDPSYAYLLARLLDDADSLSAGEAMVRKWPDFAYGHHYYGHALAFRAALYQKALDHFRTALRLDPESPSAELITSLEQAVAAEARVSAIPFTCDDKVRNLDSHFSRTEVQQTGRNKYRFRLLERFDAAWKTKVLVEVELRYIGPTPINLGFEFETVVSEPIRLAFLLVGTSQDSSVVRLSFDPDDFGARKNRVKFTVPAAEAAAVTEFRLVMLRE